ncbi:hypothetical protein PDIDSM_8072 [Penicillium digitatum]|nr:hypothetical protein PDIDSM_8072 [Penicillium digitatum]
MELEATLKRMDEKLDNLSSIFQKNDRSFRQFSGQAIHDTQGITSSPSNSHPVAFSPTFVSETENPYAIATPYLDTGRIMGELSLSERHSTAPQHLLSWPCSSLQMSELELQYPVNLEINRSKHSRSTTPLLFLQSSLMGDTWPSRLSLSQMSLLTQSYFQHFHPSCLVLDEAVFYRNTLRQAMKTNFAKDFDTCTVLLVCALGSITAYHSGQTEWSSGFEQDVGIEFFNLANQMFRDLEGANWHSVQCLLLMGMFYSATVRVYDAWQVIHRACSTISILVPLGPYRLKSANYSGLHIYMKAKYLPNSTFRPAGSGSLQAGYHCRWFLELELILLTHNINSSF